MEHHFNVEIAKEYGLVESILFYNISYWVVFNKANNIHFYEGRYWTFNSARAYAELFPYLSRSTIQRALNHLKDEELIMDGEFNERSFDRTKWYSLTDKGLMLVQNEQLDSPKWVMGVAQNGPTIPIINPIDNIYITDNKHNTICTEQNAAVPQDVSDNNKFIVPTDNIRFLTKQVIDYLNEKTSSNYKSTSNKTLSLIKARSREGFVGEDFVKVIDIKTADWINNPEMRKYLRPETLFGTKFESYLNQKPSTTGNKVSDKWGI